ncbi:hypothetical protein, partial [Saccharopolyspora erythraea]
MFQENTDRADRLHRRRRVTRPWPAPEQPQDAVAEEPSTAAGGEHQRDADPSDTGPSVLSW